MKTTDGPSRRSQPSTKPTTDPDAVPDTQPETESAETPAPWYKEGLRFGCTGCGACCTIEGHVWVDRHEVRSLAEHLGLELDDFGRKYLRQVGLRHSLTEIPFPGDPAKKACVFWDGRCSVYEARPRQCRTFPFWEESLETPETWQEAVDLSPGVNSGRLYQLGEIETLRSGNGEAVDSED